MIVRLLILVLIMLVDIGIQHVVGTVYIYADQGTSQESLQHLKYTLTNRTPYYFKTQTINANEVIAGVWRKNAIAFFMPGGADLPYKKLLDGPGNQQIVEYVRAGGVYVGICAGAYYAAQHVEFAKGSELEVIGSRELAFFQGSAVGPILAPYDYRTNSGARVAKLIFNDQQIGMAYFNGGPYFKGNIAGEVIAHYADNNLPAIIQISVGKGKAILSGVHWEYQANLLNKKDEYIKPLLSDMYSDITLKTRKRLLRKILRQ